MGYKAKVLGFQTVPLSEGYSATIRKLDKKQMDLCTSKLLTDARQHTEMTPGEQATTISESSMDNAAYTTELLVQGLVSWTLDDDDESPLPLNRQTIEGLSAEDSGTLVVAISNLSAGIDPKSGSAGQNGSSSAQKATTPLP